jgi:hypothetical protein
MNFIQELKIRNESLYYFGLVCMLLSFAFLLASKFSHTQIYGVNAWLKPLKFALSTWAYAWAMAWYIGHLEKFNATIFNYVVIITLGFEIVYIAYKAFLGTTSHYNMSTPLNAALFSLMAAAATIATIATAYIGLQFFKNNFPSLPINYLWAIRFAIILFVIFAFEGFAMGARLSHTVGANNDNSNLYILGWSMKYGDLRIAHFIGMHALQVLPILAFYLLKNTYAVFIASALYFALAVFTLVQAVQGQPLFTSPKTESAPSSKS